MSGKTPDRENQISVPAVKNLKLVAFMFETMENCSKGYRIQYVNSTSVLHYQHQWKLEQKKSDNIELPLKLVRGKKGTLLAYMVWCHVKVAHTPLGSSAYLNFDQEMTPGLPSLMQGQTSG